MTPLVESHSKVTFGLFEAHLQNGELWKAGKRIKIQSQPFKVLVALLEHPGEVVSKEELQLRLRGKDTTVDFDRSLGTAINKLRAALSDSSDNPRFIQTLSRRGYRFIAPVGYPPDPLKETSNLTIIPTPFSVDDPGAADAFAVAAPVPVPEATPPVSSASLPRGRKWPLLYVGGAVIAVVSAFSFGILLGHSHAADAPLRITQITHNGRISPGAPSMESLPSTATDGVHIFASVIENGRPVLSQISIADGTVRPLAVLSEIAAPSLGDLSPDGTRLLVRSHLSPESEQALWVVPVGGGSARRVANILAHDAAWMPDGHSILYAAGNDLFVTHLGDDGSTLVAHLPGRAFWLRWSPDGQLLRFTILDPIGHTTSLWELPAGNHTPRPLLKGWSNPVARMALLQSFGGRLKIG